MIGAAPSASSVTPPPSRWRAYLPVLPVLVLAQILFFMEARARCVFWFGGRRYAFLVEDAMISMRYAYNLAHGNGLVWNPGERVQGFTNLGWTLVMAVAECLAPLEEAAILVLVAGFLVHAALILVVFRTARPLGTGMATLAAFLVGCSGPLLLWGTGGMETGLVALLALLACAPWMRNQLPDSWMAAGLFAGLGFMVRSDGGVLFALIAMLAFAHSWRHPGQRRSLLLPVVVGLVPLATVLLFQRIYYQSWLPNTFLAKVAGGATDLGRGLAYLWRSIAADTFNAPLAVGGLLGLWARRQRGQSVARPALLVGGWLGYVAWVGGDAFVGARFWAAVIPLLALMSAEGLGWLLSELRSAWHARRRFSTAALASLLLVFSLLLIRHEQLVWSSFREYDRPTNAHLSSLMVGLAIERSSLPRDRPVAVLAAGITPYFAASHRFHDMLGKCDRAIAGGPAHPGIPGHRKWSFRHSLDALRPSLVITSAPYDLRRSDQSYAQAAATDQEVPFVPALWIDPIFRARYRQNRVRIFFHSRYVDTGHWIFAADDVGVQTLQL